MHVALSNLPDAELEVMQALWSLDTYPAHTAAIAQRLNKNWKAPTLLKLLSRLRDRGFVQEEKQGRANLYTPLVQEEDYLRVESRSFLHRLHHGSLSSLVASLYPDTHLTPEDLQALERILKKEED